jgi:peroxiredoxin
MRQLMKSLLVLVLLSISTIAQAPKVGERAKDFQLPSAKGATVALRDYAGKSNVVLVFYRGYW